jgi:hypothetical protein
MVNHVSSTHHLRLTLDFEKIIARVIQQPPLRLVAIDGLPLAGKATLADHLALVLGTECVTWLRLVRAFQ